jgi:hypothetical protein
VGLAVCDNLLFYIGIADPAPALRGGIVNMK